MARTPPSYWRARLAAHWPVQLRRNPMRKYIVATPAERLEWWLMPLVCKVVGHSPEQKMSCTICRRCRTVLEDR